MACRILRRTALAPLRRPLGPPRTLALRTYAMVAPNLAVPEQYALPPLPTVGGIGPDGYVLDVFRVAAAQVISEAVGVEVETALLGVDIGVSCAQRGAVGC